MRKLISLLCAVALVISLAPNPRLALANSGGGGGDGGGARDLFNPSVVVQSFIMGRTAFDFLVVALLIGSVQQLMMIQLSLFAAPIQQKSKKAKQNWSSSASSWCRLTPGMTHAFGVSLPASSRTPPSW